MPVYLFSFHAYRSWNADDRRGYVEYKRGIQPPNAKRAQQYDRNATQAPVLFDKRELTLFLSMSYDACTRRQWRLHAFASEPTHVHLLVSWREFEPWQAVRKKLKNLMSLQLGRDANARGRRWFSGDGSRKQVRDGKHFAYLMDVYLPRHLGLVWREGDPTPPPPTPVGG
jgi:REP element-mobilizing transposase RayT